MTLRWRIALILAAVAFSVGAIAGTSAWLTTASQLHSAIDASLRGAAQTLNSQGGGGGDHGQEQQSHGGVSCPPAASFQPASAAQIVAPDGTVLKCITGGTTLQVTKADTALSGAEVQLRTVTGDGVSYRLLSTPWREGGTLQVARSLRESNHVLDGLRLELVALVGAITLLTAALGWAIATRVARPIMRLRDATQSIATTLDFSVPITVRGTGEVRSLADSFRAMIAAVMKSQDQQRRLVSDASHEMRTPLTSLRSNVELLGKIERLPQAERAEVVKDVLEDIDELSSLMGELVDLASDLNETEQAEPIALADVAHTVAARTERRLGRKVSVQERAAASVMARPRQLERALSNLVDNAIKYSDAPSPVEIVVDGGKVTVMDHGRGIAPEDLDRIFDRFYRAVDVRSDPGSGLGLSIVEEIVHTHGGEVFAINREGGGAAIGFTIPTDTNV